MPIHITLRGNDLLKSRKREIPHVVHLAAVEMYYFEGQRLLFELKRVKTQIKPVPSIKILLKVKLGKVKIIPDLSHLPNRVLIRASV